MMARLTPVVELFRELKRRKVINVAAVYLGGVIVGVDAVNNLMDMYGLPLWFQRTFGVLVVIGFPAAVLVSWWYDWTDGTIRKANTEALAPAVRRLALGSAVGLILLAAGIGTAVASRGNGTATAVEADVRNRSVAIVGGTTVLGMLPIEYVGRDESGSWLCETVAGLLERALSDVPAFTVVTRQTLGQYVARGTPLDSLALMLDVDYLIQAQVRSTPNGSSVLVTLVEGATSEVAASDLIPVPARSPEAAIDSLVFQIAEMLRLALGQEMERLQWQRGTGDSVAFRLRHQAEYRSANARALARQDLAAAEREFAAADSLLALAGTRDRGWIDPHLARARLAEAWALARRFTRDYQGAAAMYDHGLAEADAALGHNPGSVEALALRGHLRWRKILLTGDRGTPEGRAEVDRAEADLRTALDRDPRSVIAAAALSEILYQVHGRYAEARRFALRAYEEDAYLDRAGEVINRIALSTLEVGDDQEALRWVRLGLQREPGATIHRAAVLEIMAWGDIEPDPEQAWSHLDAIATLMPPTVPYYGYPMAAVLARAGLADSARAVLERHTRTIGDDTRDRYLYLEAAVRFRLGDIREARRLFDRYRAIAPDGGAEAASRRMLRDFVDLTLSG